MTNLTMLNFSSISLANTKVKYALFVLSYVLAAALYWPSFSGQPVWDDLTFWFYDPVMDSSFPYSQIWRNFTWPLSVSLQKGLYGIAGDNYPVYHAINFLLHGFNSWLVYRFLRLVRISLTLSFVGFLLFLIHPASVITVAWMIQFKTLICFTFAIGSLILFVSARDWKVYALSVFLFLLSVLSKSSALPFPIVLFFFLGKSWKSKRALWIIPYLLVSIGGYYRLTNSQIATEGIKQATEVAVKVVEKAPPVTTEETNDVAAKAADESFKPIPDAPLVIPKEDFAPENVDYDKAGKWASPVEPTKSNEEDPKLIAHARLFIKTLYYYFWQTFLPVDNAPVKGLNPFPPSFQDYLHLFFLFILSVIAFRLNLLPPLIGAHVLLLPYLGIIPAPYMNVTWVSDQHLYLSLPCFILFALGLAEKLKGKWIIPVVALVFAYYAYQTNEASRLYKNNFVFYESSIHSNFNNIPLVYNLSILYVLHGRTDDAISLIQSVIEVSKEEPYIKENRFFPFIINLHSQLVDQ